MDSRARLKSVTRRLKETLPALPEGHLLGSTYLVELDRPLGAGGQGAVYPGIHVRLDLPVAVKIFAADEMLDDKQVARFVQEARILARLNSPNLVRVWDLDRLAITGFYYFVTEFVEGAALSEALEGLRRPLTEAEAVATAIAAARGLADMHLAGIIHRDFKPGNALWAAGTERVKVCDLGLAKGAGQDQMELTLSGETFGSPAYMAPEQAHGARDVSPRADVYSLGALLHFLLTREPPKSISSLQDLIKSGKTQDSELTRRLEECRVSVETRTLVAQMLARRPEDRPEDANVALVELERLLARLPGGATVRLAETYKSSTMVRPMERRLVPVTGHLWMPPEHLERKARSDTVRFQSLEEASQHPVPAPDRERERSESSQHIPGFETQFWESAFPVLKEERERKKRDKAGPPGPAAPEPPTAPPA